VLFLSILTKFGYVGNAFIIFVVIESINIYCYAFIVMEVRDVKVVIL
jgi:hypothetical protein